MRQRLQKRPIQPEQEQAHQKMGPSSGISNQAMLSMLESQDTQTAHRTASGGAPLDKAMRAKFERQFGLPMGDVRIHHNSDKPAKFDAGAYTYGTDIFIGPGQEDTLEHEMTHVAQQMLGQVRPTGMEHGMAVNHSPALEQSADLGTVSPIAGGATGPVVQCARSSSDYLPKIPGREGEFARHHIIPYLDMEQFADILRQYDSHTFKQLGTLGAQSYLRLWKSMGLNGQKAESDKYGTFMSQKELSSDTFFEEMFRWLPGNLVLGPKNDRANDPGNQFDVEALNARLPRDKTVSLKVVAQYKRAYDIIQKIIACKKRLESEITGLSESKQTQKINDFCKYLKTEIGPSDGYAALKSLFSGPMVDGREFAWQLKPKTVKKKTKRGA